MPYTYEFDSKNVKQKNYLKISYFYLYNAYVQRHLFVQYNGNKSRKHNLFIYPPHAYESVLKRNPLFV